MLAKHHPHCPACMFVVAIRGRFSTLKVVAADGVQLVSFCEHLFLRFAPRDSVGFGVIINRFGRYAQPLPRLVNDGPLHPEMQTSTEQTRSMRIM